MVQYVFRIQYPWRLKNGCNYCHSLRQACDSRKTRGSLKKLGRETKKEKGNLCFHMHTKEDDSSTFIFYENYASEEAFATHLGSPHAKRFGDVFTAQKLGRAETTIVRLSKVEL